MVANYNEKEYFDTTMNRHPSETEQSSPNFLTRNFVKGVVALSIGASALTGCASNNGEVHAVPTHNDKEASQSPAPTVDGEPATQNPDKPAKTAEIDEATKAELSIIDNEAKNSPETFMQRPLSERLLWRDQYTQQVEDAAKLWVLHAKEHYIVNKEPGTSNDGQTIINDYLVSLAGLTRGFIADPSDENGNKWTQDYSIGTSFMSAYLALGQENPNSSNLKERLDYSLNYTRDADKDFAPLNDDIVVQNTVDGDAIEIEGQKCPTKIIKAISTYDSYTNLIEVTMALFTYKDSSGNEKKQWVEYNMVNLD